MLSYLGVLYKGVCHRFGFPEKQTMRWRLSSRFIGECSSWLPPGKGKDESRIILRCSLDQGLSQLHRKLWGCHGRSQLSQVWWRRWAFISLCQAVVVWVLPWGEDMTLGEVTLFSWGNAAEGQQLRARCQQHSLQLREELSQDPDGGSGQSITNGHCRVFLWHLVTLDVCKPRFRGTCVFIAHIESHICPYEYMFTHGVVHSMG